MDSLSSATDASSSVKTQQSVANSPSFIQKIQEVVRDAFAGYSIQNADQLVTLLDRCLSLSPTDQALAKKTFDDLDTPSKCLLERLITDHNENCTAAALKLIRLGVKAIHTKNAGGGYHQNYTLVHVAAAKGKFSVLQALVEAGADPDAVAGCGMNPKDPKWSMTPLSCCLQEMHPRLYSVRISKEAEARYKAVFDYLLKKGADPKKGNVCRNPVLNACIDSHLEELAWAVLDRSEIEAVDVCQDTPLFLACVHRMDKLAGELLRRGAKPDVLVSRGC